MEEKIEKDMKGKSLNIAANLSPPYVFLEQINNLSRLTGGIEVKLLESLSEHFNFTYNVINCNSDWGVLLDNNTWTGLIGKIASKEADLAFGGLTVNKERSEAVFFTHPHIITTVSFITPPPKSEPIITLVIEPFDPLVWVCVITSFILMVFAEWLISQNFILLKKFDINWAIISTLLRQQLSCHLPSVGPLRIIFCCWLLSCLVLTASYSGCLYSLMAVPTRLKTINTLNELAVAQRNGLIQVTAIGGSSYFNSLKFAKFGIYREIGKYIKPIRDKQEGLDIVRNSTKAKAYAYISTRDHLNYGVLKFGSKSYHMPPPTQESTVFVDVMAIAMQREFEHKNQFNKFISNIKKGGFLEYWNLSEIRKLMKNSIKVDSNQYESNGYNNLYLEQLQSAFYLFIFGEFVSLIVFLVQIIYIKFCHKSK